jgi:hypothetical protein
MNAHESENFLPISCSSSEMPREFVGKLTNSVFQLGIENGGVRL